MKRLLKRAMRTMGYAPVPTGTIGMDVRQMRHLLCLADLYSMLGSVEGAIVECGVGKGRSFLQFAHLAQPDARELWGFDSFQGFPEPAKEDVSARAPKKGDWNGTNPEDILRTLQVAGIPKAYLDAKVRLVPGFFDRTLSRYDGGPIAFLHIDADLYEAYRDCLTVLVPQVAAGGVVLFDEYGEDKWPGAKKAVDQFLEGTPWKLERHAAGGKWYFIKRP